MDAFFVGNGEDAADLFRIAVVPQDPGQQGLVRAVAFVGFGEGTGQFDFTVLGLALEQLDVPPEREIKKRSMVSV